MQKKQLIILLRLIKQLKKGIKPKYSFFLIHFSLYLYCYPKIKKVPTLETFGLCEFLAFKT